MSTNLMYVTDRFMLGGYSVDAMNASVISGNWIAIFTWFFVGIASSAEVFVGQFNGSKQYDKLAVPVWQMIYLSIASCIILVPIGIFAEQLNTLPDYYMAHGVEYQRPIFYFGFLPGLIAALSAFFIGQGRTRIVTYVVFLGCAINIGLDYVFIYMFNKGCFGAAVATVISEATQVAVLSALFINKATLRCVRFDKKIMSGCFKIGFPISLGHFLSLLVWYLLYLIVAKTSKDMATMHGLLLNVWILFSFISEAMQKASATISANMIGQKDLTSIKKTFKTFVIIVGAFVCLCSIPLVFFPEITFNLIDLLEGDISYLYPILANVFPMLLISIFIESIMSVTWGILVSGGDSRYPLIVNQLSSWLFLLIPSFVLFKIGLFDSICIIYALCILWSTASFAAMYARYKGLKWYKKLV